METALRPYAIHRDEGETLSFFGALTWIKATGAQTGGAFGLIEQIVPPGAGSPWHLHHNEDESFYVIERDAAAWRLVDVECDGRDHRAQRW
jgi:mannose-6-phosphate isomerase-like protein (cupin superfamily)